MPCPIRCPWLASGLILVAAASFDPRPAPAAGPTGAVRGIKVQPDRAPDCSSLKAIAESVTRGLERSSMYTSISNWPASVTTRLDFPFPGGPKRR